MVRADETNTRWRRVLDTLRGRSSKRRPLSRTPDIDSARFLFVGGLHRSGTSILHRLLREHEATTGFDDTGAPQDEGQFLQTVFPPAREHGGVGRFAFDLRTHMTERSPLTTPEARDQLLREWGAYYDLSKDVLLEKSPPNLIRSRFLQALFPEARFVFIVRHPVPVALATQKWSKTSIFELVLHWLVAHSLMLDDLDALRSYVVVRYEDFAAAPQEHLDEICDLAGLARFSPREPVADHNDRYFARWQKDHATEGRLLAGALDQHAMATLGYSLSEPFVRELAP